MSDFAINLLDDLMENGANTTEKTTAAAIKVLIIGQVEMNEKLDGIDDHIKDKEIHTPKGILIRKEVLGPCIGGTIFISAIVAHAPELIKWLVGIF